VSNQEYFYVTTPIYYVNDVPHIGHAYTTVAADVLARWYRLKGYRVHFLTGMDEHGEKVAKTAAEKGMTPQEWCDHMAPHFQAMLELLDISNDDFIRTTEERHVRGVVTLLETLQEKDALYLRDYEGPYCVACETYLTGGELVDAEGGAGGNLCPIHKSPVDHLREHNWFFRLSNYRDRLLDHIKEHPEFIEPATRRNEVISFLEEGLNDISFSRSTIIWGVPLPWDTDQVAYVWPDALANYMTAVGYGTNEERFHQDWPASLHLVGKDILRFHTIIWPAILMAADLPLPRQVFVHGWLLAAGEKMSKTRANKIAPSEIVDGFGVDCSRYYFLRDVSFGLDGSFSWEAMLQRYNADLANDIGNLASRVLNMVERYLDGLSPKEQGVDGDDGGEIDALQAALTSAVSVYGERFEALDFDDGLLALWGFFHAANRFVEDTTPWHLAKDKSPAAQARLREVLGAALEALRISAVLLSPVMPGAARRLWDKLGLEAAPDAQILEKAVIWGQFPAGTRVTKGDPLFPRKEI